MSGTNACKLVCDEGTFYLAYNSTVDTFTTRPFKTAAEFAAFAAKNLTVFADEKLSIAEWEKMARNTKDVYTMTRETRHQATFILSKMKRGELITDDEAMVIHEFWRFLQATVADHQHEYKEVSPDVINRWIDELEMRSQFPKNFDYEDILDCAKWSSFQKVGNRRRFPRTTTLGEEKESTPQQLNKLAGRYVSALALIAKIVGQGKSPPLEIVNTFLDK